MVHFPCKSGVTTSGHFADTHGLTLCRRLHPSVGLHGLLLGRPDAVCDGGTVAEICENGHHCNTWDRFCRQVCFPRAIRVVSVFPWSVQMHVAVTSSSRGVFTNVLPRALAAVSMKSPMATANDTGESVHEALSVHLRGHDEAQQ